MVAPALDRNPRRIKQFVNLFRLRALIATQCSLGQIDVLKLLHVSPAVKTRRVEKLEEAPEIDDAWQTSFPLVRRRTSKAK